MESDGEKIDYISWDILLRRHYDKVFGIVHADAALENPLASVSMFPKEDWVTGGSLESRIWRYSKYDIEKRYHVSLVEFLSLPRWVTDSLFQMAGEEIESEAPSQEKLKREMDKIDREGKVK